MLTRLLFPDTVWVNENSRLAAEWGVWCAAFFPLILLCNFANWPVLSVLLVLLQFVTLAICLRYHYRAWGTYRFWRTRDE